MQLFWNYIRENWVDLLSLTYDHILMVFIGIFSALVVGIPLGMLAARRKRLAPVIMTIGNILQVFPSLAMLVLLMIVFGLGFKTVVIGLFLYSLMPIIRNTYVGLKQVDPSITEAGRGVGMSSTQLLFKVQLPLSLPFIMTGIRVAAVIAIGVATIAPLVGGGGLGREIYSGINMDNAARLYAGAVPAALLALIADLLFGRLEKKMKLDR
ncbi:ABC transporter permease [Paenibacillus larvae]|uniref:Glycine betaine/carnitine/choline transport system permease protein OpuCD n=4 Tax=Paenibacillus larvae TaxID=1464 RepID=V9W4N8_9BACL|nr:ABC transporter permease [Paenibacillus larvae]AHD04600.1 glycine betaine/carnitine/choline transport system permease protein OpuCD [Paenibacillus larvae subsp. larvae DSM 25430]AQR78282.1 amino acid ABC transporter permease [Paenibacillus larvae subsp. larvae]AQT84529.1 amino acid ABC transporter permease [Paenibacillus larvae subsp. pulvifaciens]AQZ46526.1 amino acid ABC transporter permease [Paenibacillus larvae subsp. pulvifaciens]ARF67931.1 amino acid ABC transporter permease [Paenibac